MLRRRISRFLIGSLALVATALPSAAAADHQVRNPVLVYSSVPDVTVGEPGNPDGFAELFKVRADGAEFRRLTRTEWWEYGPAWSPDGRRIAYSRGDPYCHAGSCEWGPIAASIWVTTPEGRGRRPLTDADAALENSWLEESPTWSPDATKVAFVRDDNVDGSDPTNGIYIVGADGRGLARISRAKPIALDWSPRGSTIAYVDSRGRYVALLDAATGRARRLHIGGPRSFQSIAWSPRGGFLAAATGSAVYVVPARGGSARKVVAWRGAGDVDWSHDGCCLAFSAMRKGARYGRTDIYVVSVRGGRPRRLTSSRGADFDPAWRR